MATAEQVLECCEDRSFAIFFFQRVTREETKMRKLRSSQHSKIAAACLRSPRLAEPNQTPFAGSCIRGGGAGNSTTLPDR